MSDEIKKGTKVILFIHFLIGIIFGIILFLVPLVLIEQNYWPAEFHDPIDPIGYRVLGAALLAFSFGSLIGVFRSNWDEIKSLVLVEVIWNSLAAIGMLIALLITEPEYPPLIILFFVLISVIFIILFIILLIVQR